jgi:hypothetical protein
MSAPPQTSSTKPVISAQPQEPQQREPSFNEKAMKAIREYNSSHYQPIFFYGQVIDQNTNPLAGAEVSVSIPQSQVFAPNAAGDFPVTNNLLHLTLETGADGRFEITGESGTGVDFESIKKDGFEVEPMRRAQGAQQGSIDSPIIFKMWNTNIHEQLITGKPAFEIVPDGRSYFINLTSGAISEDGNGDLQVVVKYADKVERNRLYDWSCQINVVNGGLLEETTRAAMYLAPAEGYTNSFQMQDQIKGGQRGEIGERRFYLLLKNRKEYGQMTINVNAPYNDDIPGLIRLSYAINPSGSRILR